MRYIKRTKIHWSSNSRNEVFINCCYIIKINNDYFYGYGKKLLTELSLVGQIVIGTIIMY